MVNMSDPNARVVVAAFWEASPGEEEAVAAILARFGAPGRLLLPRNRTTPDPVPAGDFVPLEVLPRSDITPRSDRPAGLLLLSPLVPELDAGVSPLTVPPATHAFLPLRRSDRRSCKAARIQPPRYPRVGDRPRHKTNLVSFAADRA